MQEKKDALLIFNFAHFSPLKTLKPHKVWKDNSSGFFGGAQPQLSSFIRLGDIEEQSQKLQIWLSQ